MRLTADELVTAVNRRCGWASTHGPLADSTGSETHVAALLAIAGEELVGDSYPLVMATAGDYYVTLKDWSVVAGQRRYRLPKLHHNAIKDVVWVDADGNERPLATIDPEDVPGHYVVTVGTAECCSYYLEGDYLCLSPVPQQAVGSLRLKYYRQPGRLVLTTSNSVAPVTDFVYGSGSATEALVSWTTGQLNPDNQVCDIVGGGNAHAALVVDATMSSFIGDVSLFTWPENPLVAAGDYLVLSGYSPVVQLPDHMQPYFIRRVAGACLMVVKEYDAAAAELREASALYEKAQSTSRPRNAAEPRTIITRNSPLRLRGGYAWRP